MQLPFQIYVPTEIVPVHSLDVVGTIVDAKKLGERAIAVFEDWASRNRRPDRCDDMIVLNYLGLLEGKDSAVADKVNIIRALQGPLAEAGIKITYTPEILLEDGLAVMDYMVRNGNAILLHSTESIEGLVGLLPNHVQMGVLDYHQSDKRKTEAFTTTYKLMEERGARIVSHSEDDLTALVAASQAPHFKDQNGLLVFVNRNDKVTQADAMGKGIHMYVNKLTDVPYADLVR